MSAFLEDDNSMNTEELPQEEFEEVPLEEQENRALTEFQKKELTKNMIEKCMDNLKQELIEQLTSPDLELKRRAKNIIDKHKILCKAISGSRMNNSDFTLNEYFFPDLHIIFNKNEILEEIIKNLANNTNCAFLHEIYINFNSEAITEEEINEAIYIYKHIGKENFIQTPYKSDEYKQNEINKYDKYNKLVIPFTFHHYKLPSEENTPDAHQNILIIHKEYDKKGKLIVTAELFEPNGVFSLYTNAYVVVEKIVNQWFGENNVASFTPPYFLCPEYLQNNRLQASMAGKWSGTCTTFSFLYAILRVFFINWSSDDVYNFMNYKLKKHKMNYIINVIKALVGYIDFSYDNKNKSLIVGNNNRKIPFDSNTEMVEKYTKVFERPHRDDVNYTNLLPQPPSSPEFIIPPQAPPVNYDNLNYAKSVDNDSNISYDNFGSNFSNNFDFSVDDYVPISNQKTKSEQKQIKEAWNLPSSRNTTRERPRLRSRSMERESERGIGRERSRSRERKKGGKKHTKKTTKLFRRTRRHR